MLEMIEEVDCKPEGVPMPTNEGVRTPSVASDLSKKDITYDDKSILDCLNEKS